MALNLLIIKSKQRLFYHSVANIREPRSTSTTYGTCAHQFSILIIESLQPTLTPSLTVGWLTLPPYESLILGHWISGPHVQWCQNGVNVHLRTDSICGFTIVALNASDDASSEGGWYHLHIWSLYNLITAS